MFKGIKLNSKQRIITVLVFFLITLIVGFTIEGYYERCTSMKDAGLIRIYPQDVHTESTTYARGKVKNTKEYIDFYFTVDGENYNLSMTRAAAGLKEGESLDIGSNGIERYVLYSQEHSEAFLEHISIEDYKRSAILDSLWMILLGISFAFLPSFFYKMYLAKAIPNYKNNHHTRDEDQLVAWKTATYMNLFLLWALIEAGLVIFFIALLDLDPEVGQNKSLILISVVLFELFLFSMILCIKTQFVVIYSDEIVCKIKGKTDIYPREQISSRVKILNKKGQYMGYKLIFGDRSIYLHASSFVCGNLEDFLRAKKYI